MLEVVDVESGEPVVQDEHGAFLVRDQREYILASSEGPLQDHRPVLTVQRLGGTARLCFDNYVGLATVAGHRFRVANGKLTDTAFDKMLDDVVTDFGDLAFHYNSPTSLPFEREVSANDSVAYHALAYLRHVMRRVAHGESLLGQFQQIARNPHRRTLSSQTWVPIASATAIGTSGLIAIATQPEKLGRIHPSSSSRQQVLVGCFLGAICFRTR